MSDQLKPFAVTFEFSAIVMATDAAHAKVVAASHRSEIVGDVPDNHIDITTCEAITREGQLSMHGYDGDSLAYGGDDTCLAEIIAALPVLDTKTVDMFASGSGDTPA